MAAPKWHAIPTAVFAILSIVFYTPLIIWGEGAMVLLLVLFLGVFMDIDHLSIRRIKKILRGKEKGPIKGWINWMHTWQFMIAVIALSLAIWNFLPLLSYVLHILVDGMNRTNLKYKTSPLPISIHRFYPECMKYDKTLIV